MTSETVVAAPFQNGVVLSAHLQADFYAKLSRIESEVLAGKHPRLKLPAEAVERFEPAFAQSQSKPAAATSTTSRSNETNKPPILSPQRPQQQPLLNASLASPSSQRPNSSQLSFGARQTPSSQIDPILLTKSDELVRAETNLKRQRIERTLKDAVEAKKKTISRPADQTAYDAPNHFDGSKILVDALLRVKPISRFQAADTNQGSGASSPFDEDSYYSSKGNSWTSEEQDAARNTEFSGYVAESGNHEQLQVTPRRRAQANQSGVVSTRVPSGSFSVADKSPRNIAQQADTTGPSPRTQGYTRQLQDQREESYSPPGVSEFPNPTRIRGGFATNGHGLRTPPALSRVRESESYSPPSPAVPLVQNQLGPPIAPQPARISPLASIPMPHYAQNDQAHRNNQAAPVTQQAAGNKRKRDDRHGQKQPEPYPIDELERNNGEFHGQRNASGSYRQPLPLQQPHGASNRQQNQQQNNKQNRKRKKNNVNGQSSPKPASKRAAQGAASPIPYIKQEPVSPPPMSSSQRREPPRRLVLRDDGHADIEVYSPTRDAMQQRNVAEATARPQTRHADAMQPPQSTPRYQTQRPREQMPIVIDSPRISSPAIRQPVRDHVDIRKAATVQYASRPYSTEPTAAYHPQEVQYIRAPSRQLAERALPPERYLEEPQYSYRQQLEPTSPTYRFDDDVPVEIAARRAMPPPPNRRIVDQYGNEYVAVQASSKRHQSAVREIYPEPRPPPYEQDLYREQSVRARPQSMRPPPQVIELDDDEDDYRRMPPPPSSSRQRFVQIVDQAPRRTVSYQPQPSARSMSLQPAGQSMRDSYMVQPPPPMYANDGEPYGARDRPYSARPQVVETSPQYTRRIEYGPADGVYRNW